ncbi:MAG: hypothetical protein WA958_02815, partial [Tunicatimonas sp.]
MIDSVEDKILEKIVVSFLAVNAFGVVIPITIYWISELFASDQWESSTNVTGFLFYAVISTFSIIYFTAPLITFYLINYNKKDALKKAVTSSKELFLWDAILVFRMPFIFVSVCILSIIVALGFKEVCITLVIGLGLLVFTLLNAYLIERFRHRSYYWILLIPGFLGLLPLILLSGKIESEKFNLGAVKEYYALEDKIKGFEKDLHASIEKDYTMSKAEAIGRFNDLFGNGKELYRTISPLERSAAIEFQKGRNELIQKFRTKLRNSSSKDIKDLVIGLSQVGDKSVKNDKIVKLRQTETIYYLVKDLISNVKLQLFESQQVAKKAIAQKLKIMQLLGLFVFSNSLVLILISRKIANAHLDDDEKISTNFAWIFILLIIPLFQKIEMENISLQSPYSYLTTANWYFPAAIPKLVSPKEETIITTTNTDFGTEKDSVFEEMLDEL